MIITFNFNILNIFQDKICILLDAVKNNDEKLAHQFKKTEEWATVEEIMAAHGQLYTIRNNKKKNQMYIFLKLDINNYATIFVCEYCHRKLLCEFIMWKTFMHSNMTLGSNSWLGLGL